jgi:hypothetical protein
VGHPCGCDDEANHVCDWHKIERLERELAALKERSDQARANLATLEWLKLSGSALDGPRSCPICRGTEPEHVDGCDLEDALLS